jgi:uridine phosphorylase
VEIFFTELDALANIDLNTREIKSRKKKLKVIRIGTSGGLQEDIPVGSHLVTDYAVGLDSLMNFYHLPMDLFEKGIAADIQHEVGLPFMPYVVRGSASLLDQIGHDMIVGNTVTTPGFYAPQGRNIRAESRMPKLLEQLNYYHNKSGEFWLTNFEMETAAYYAMGRMLGHDVLSANAIIANRMKNKFSRDPEKVIDSLIKKVLDRI